jgi:hypothetical protein
LWVIVVVANNEEVNNVINGMGNLQLDCNVDTLEDLIPHDSRLQFW